MLCIEQPAHSTDEAWIVALQAPEPAAPIATRWKGNALQLDAADLDRFAAQTLLVNSGSLGSDLFDRHPRNWMAGATANLAAHLASLRREIERLDIRFLIEPHSRHILHDAPTAAAFLREHGDERLGLALNPCALFEPSMITFAEDHLRRIAEALAPLASAFVLADAARDASGENLLPTDLGRGEFDPLINLQVVLEQAVQAVTGAQVEPSSSSPVPRPAGEGVPAVILRRVPAGAAGESLAANLHRLLARRVGD